MIIWQLLDEFRCHIQRSTLDRSQYDSVGGHGSCKTKVTQFDDTIGGYQNVLWFHISMDDPVRVQIIEGMNQLLCDFPHFVFWKFAVIFQDFKQLTLSEFSNHTKLMTCFERVKEQNNIFVVQAF